MRSYNSKVYKRNRGYLLVIYSMKCFLCDKMHANLECHHIDHNELNHRLDNLVLLCKFCHKLVHLKRFVFQNVLTSHIAKACEFNLNLQREENEPFAHSCES